MRSIFIVLLALLFARAAVAQNCDVGCPCGNTCISCQDTCRVGAGTAGREGGAGDADPVVTVLFFVGLGVVFAGSLALIYFANASEPCALPAIGPPAPVATARQRSDVIAECIANLCGLDEDCRAREHDSMMKAPSTDRWLTEHGCAP